jgi:hypothetical protein
MYLLTEGSRSPCLRYILGFDASHINNVKLIKILRLAVLLRRVHGITGTVTSLESNKIFGCTQYRGRGKRRDISKKKPCQKQ